MAAPFDAEAISKLSLDDMEALLSELAEHRKFNKLDFFELYPKQREFIAMGWAKQERMLFAGNQLGKCNLFNSLVDHPDGTSTPAGVLYERGMAFSVLSWDGEAAVPAAVSCLIEKPPEPGVRLYFRNGRTVEVALGHYMLTLGGSWLSTQQLLEGLPCLLPSSSALSPPVQKTDALRCLKTAQDFLADCFQGSRPCDERLRFAEAGGPTLQTSQAGVLQRSLLALPSDAIDLSIGTSSGRTACGLLASLCALARPLVRSAGYLARAAYTSAPRRKWIPRGVTRLLAGSASLARSACAVLRYQGKGAALLSPFNDGNHIIAYEPLPCQPVYDFTVPGYENYIAAGVVHHNSVCGAYEAAMHATGLYSKDWEGRRWERPTKGWAAGVSTGFTRDISQRLLCGEPGVDLEFGTGFIPKHCFVDKPSLARGANADTYDTLQIWHHTNGIRDGISTIQFKSYEQGRQKFQGSTVDWVWWDEEPPMDVYVEGNTRWSATGGMSFMTFTPMEGYSEVVCRFLRPDSTEPLEYRELRGFITMGYKDAAHMTPEMLQANLAKYPRHQWDARMNGDPLLGSGAIHVFDPGLVSFKAGFTIPLQFAKIWGVDFGITHPFAAVLLAWDRDLDVVYVVCGYRAANLTPLVHSEAIRNIAAEVPIAWPHDGHAREKGSGEQVASQYRKHNLKMLPTHATYPEGGFSTEAAVIEVDQRLQKAGGPGGMLIREDFAEMFGELREYHRKDGIIIKERDDLISGLHKGLMMKRFARPVPLGGRPRPLPGTVVRRMRSQPINPFTGEAVFR